MKIGRNTRKIGATCTLLDSHLGAFSRATQHQARTAKNRTTLATCSWKWFILTRLALSRMALGMPAIQSVDIHTLQSVHLKKTPKHGWRIVMVVVPVNWHLNWLELWQLPNHWSLLRMPCCKVLKIQHRAMRHWDNMPWEEDHLEFH